MTSFTLSHNVPSWLCLTLNHLRRKWRKPWNSCHPESHQALMAFNLLGHSPSFSRTYGIEVKCHRSTNMILYYINTNIKATSSVATTIASYLWCPLGAKYSPKFCLTGSFFTLWILFTLDHNVASVLVEGQLTRYSLPVRFKRMLESRTRTGILFLLIRPKPLIQLIVICPLERSA